MTTTRSPSQTTVDTARGRRLAAVTACVSGVAVYVNSLAVRRFDDATSYTTTKNVVAGLVLVTLAFATIGTSGITTSLRRAPRWRLAVVAVAGSVPFVLFFEGLARTDSTDAAFLHKTLVAWVAIGAVAFLGERLRVHHVVAIGAILLGQHELVGGFGLSDPGSGEALITLATLIWAVEVIVTRPLLGHVAPAVVGATRMAGGAVLLILWAAVRGSLVDIAPSTWTQLGWVLVTGATLTAYVTFWHRALAAAPAVDVTAILAGGAIVTALLNDLTGRATITAVWPGLALVGLGCLIVVAIGRIPTAAAATRSSP